MPTPPLRRRNPAVSIRRVQSERKYLTPWGGTPCHIPWKYKYDYARRTAIIPPIGPQPHMIGTSQGVLGRANIRPRYPVTPSRSEAHLQPLVLVAPPLIVGAYPPPRVELPAPPRIPLTEDEFLAQERLASFLTGETPPHRPRSLLSYPESHLYESLISQISDITKDDISIDDPAEENVYQKIPRKPSENTETSDSSSPDCESRSNKKNTKKEVSDLKGQEPVTSSRTPNNPSKVLIEPNNIQEMCSNCAQLTVKKTDESKKCPLGKWTQNFCTFENIESEEIDNSKFKKISTNFDINDKDRKTNDNQSSNENRRYDKKSSFKQSFVNNIQRNNSKNYLKSIFKIKKKSDKMETEINPTQTVVSVIHINKENGNDEVSLRESMCFKCDGSPSSKSQLEKRFNENGYEKTEVFNKPTRKSQNVDFSKTVKLNKTESFLCRKKDPKSPYSSSQNFYYERTPVIPSTVELPESVTSQKYFTTEKIYGNDKGVQVSSEDIERSQNGYADISTLDPLKPAASSSESSVNNCKNCQHEQQQQQQQQQQEGPATKDRTLQYCHSMKSPLKKTEMLLTTLKPSQQKMNVSDVKYSDEVTSLVVDFDSESSSSEEDNETVLYHTSTNLQKKKHKEDCLSVYSSTLEFYSITTTNPDSFVYVYQSPPKSSDKSSALSSLDYRGNMYSTRTLRKTAKTRYPNRGGGSSGLGSSGSETSYEDDYHDVTNYEDVTTSDRNSSVAVLEPSFHSGFESSLSSSSSSKSSRGRLCFDYSWSWTHLNDLVRRSPSIASSRRVTSPPSLGSLRLPPTFHKLSFPLEAYTKKALVI